MNSQENYNTDISISLHVKSKDYTDLEISNVTGLKYRPKNLSNRPRPHGATFLTSSQNISDDLELSEYLDWLRKQVSGNDKLVNFLRENKGSASLLIYIFTDRDAEYIDFDVDFMRWLVELDIGVTIKVEPYDFSQDEEFDV